MFTFYFDKNQRFRRLHVIVLCLHQVALLGLDLLSALVTRLQERFRAHVGTGKTPSHTNTHTHTHCLFILGGPCHH